MDSKRRKGPAPLAAPATASLFVALQVGDLPLHGGTLDIGREPVGEARCLPWLPPDVKRAERAVQDHLGGRRARDAAPGQPVGFEEILESGEQRTGRRMIVVVHPAQHHALDRTFAGSLADLLFAGYWKVVFGGNAQGGARDQHFGCPAVAATLDERRQYHAGVVPVAGETQIAIRAGAHTREPVSPVGHVEPPGRVRRDDQVQFAWQILRPAANEAVEPDRSFTGGQHGCEQAGEARSRVVPARSWSLCLTAQPAGGVPPGFPALLIERTAPELFPAGC